MVFRALAPWDGLGPAGLQVDVYDGVSAPPTDVSDVGCFVLPYPQVTALPLIKRMPRLRLVQTLNAGYDDVRALLPDGVTLCNGRGLHDASTAEHALGLILAQQRYLPTAVRHQDQHEWRQKYTLSLADSRVLIVGYGSIGQALARRLEACEAIVVPVASTAREGVHGIAELPALLPTVDIVVLIVPLTEQTEKLIGPAELALLPDNALVVNIARGKVLDTDALLVERGRIRAALDVTDPEPLPADHPLWELPGAIITPHVGGGSATFYPRARRFIAEQLRRLAAKEPLQNVVLGSPTVELT
jgi:phosphoglycerate dehydrogenase-like enzyme